MSLETADFISQLIQSNPEGTDPKSRGDDHLRLIKHVLQTQFPGFTEAVAVNWTPTQFNQMVYQGLYGIAGLGAKQLNGNSIPVVSGFFVIDNGVIANFPSGASAGDSVLQICYDTNARTQLCIVKTNGQMYSRGWNGTVWSAWQPALQGIRQTGQLDTTAGAILPVGAFGLGAVGGIHNAYNLDLPGVYNYFYAVVSGTVGTLPPGGGTGDSGINTCWDTNALSQIHFVHSTGLVWHRRRNVGTWTAWLCLDPTGNGQTWQNMMGARALGTAYTNSTGRPIMVSVSVEANAAGVARLEVTVAGIMISRDNTGAPGLTLCASVQFIVPAGNGYIVAATGAATINSWAELR